MHRSPRHLLAITGLIMLVVTPLGCGGDDPVTPDTNPPGDVTAPLVSGFAPGDRATDVPVDQVVVIEFSEPMNTATATGNVTVEPGGLTGLAWNGAGTELTVQHADWAEGATITVTVGTGLTDAAGNAIPQAFSTFFYTYSATPVVLDTMLPGGEDAMLTNGSPVFLFSAHMNRTSILVNSQVTQGSKVVPEYSVVMWNGDVRTAVFDFVDPLDALSEYTITIFGTAQAAGGTPIGSNVVLTFTTGPGADETSPRILSVVPAVDAVVPVDLDAITVTFTEPINTAQLRPASLSALLDMFIAIDPVWNADYDEMTIYLQKPLPAGVRLFAVFSESSFYDLAGNWNLETDSLSFTTQGTADLFPVRDDLMIYYNYYDSGSYNTVRQTLENVSGDNFDRVLDLWNGFAYGEEDLRWTMARQNGAILLRSVHEDEGPITFTPGVQFLPSTMAPIWTGSSQASGGDAPLIFSYSCLSEGPFTTNINLDDSKPLVTIYPLEGCYRVDMEYMITADGETLPSETGWISVSYAPGLGIFESDDYGYQYDGQEIIDSWEESYQLFGASLDDRYEEVAGPTR